MAWKESLARVVARQSAVMVAIGSGGQGGNSVWTAEAGLRFGYTFRPSGALGFPHRAAKAETCFRSPYFEMYCPPLSFTPGLDPALANRSRLSYGDRNEFSR